MRQSTQKSLLNSTRQIPLFIWCRKVSVLFLNKCSCYRDIWKSSLSLATSCDLWFLMNSSPNIIGIGYIFPFSKNCPFPLCELLKWNRLSASDLGIVVGSYFATRRTVAVWRETMSLKGWFFAFMIYNFWSLNAQQASTPLCSGTGKAQCLFNSLHRDPVPKYGIL